MGARVEITIEPVGMAVADDEATPRAVSVRQPLLKRRGEPPLLLDE